MRRYSITEAARLLGVSAATVSRRLAPERATRGRSAKLSTEELADIAAAINVDPQALRRRVDLDLDFEPGMPAEAVEWAAFALERDLQEALRAHQARIPDNLLQTNESPSFVQLPEPWGDAGDWKPITSDDQLRGLLPPLDQCRPVVG